LVLSPTGSINLGFTTEGRLAAVLIIPYLGVPNWSVIYINTAPSVSMQLSIIRKKLLKEESSFICPIALSFSVPQKGSFSTIDM
jgi:hypothetical protein